MVKEHGYYQPSCSRKLRESKLNHERSALDGNLLASREETHTSIGRNSLQAASSLGFQQGVLRDQATRHPTGPELLFNGKPPSAVFL